MECVKCMDNKNLTANIVTNNIIFNQSAEQAIDIEFTLPDFLPSINRILKCKAVSMISSKGINGSIVNIDGCVTVTVIYVNDDNKVFSYEYQYPFNKNFDIKENCQNMIIECSTSCEYINCRAVTNRKIDIHGATSIEINCIAKKSVEILSDIDNDDIEVNRISIPATTPMGCSEKYLIIEEELEIGQGQPSVMSLLRYTSTPVLKENRLINGKVIIKGELHILAIYSDEGGNLQNIKSCIPFSQILEIDGISDECETKTKISVAYIEIKPKTSSNGEIRSFLLNSKLLIKSEAYCENDIEVISDAFSKRYFAEISKNCVSIKKLIKSIQEEFSCKKSFTLNDADISSVLDLWSDVQSVNCKTEGRTVYVTGVVLVGIIAIGSEGIPVYHEKSIDFEYKCSLDEEKENMLCEADLEIISSSFTLTATGIELRLELAVNACVYQENNVCYVSDLKLDKSNTSNNTDYGAIVIYFATAGESIWNIAKQYSSTVNEIKTLNNITDNVLSTNKTLLIPIS